MELYKKGAYLIRGRELVAEEDGEVLSAKLKEVPDKAVAAGQTMAYRILKSHNTSENMEKLKLRFAQPGRQKIKKKSGRGLRWAGRD